jgi:glycerol-3-phosphate dehydrogenase
MVGEVFDLAVVGGGINGAGIAADAAGRGLKVVLLEKGDLAGGTSSASSKLIHGGLRYLEHFDLMLVRDSLAEREVLLKRAPHLIQPLRFVIPHAPGMRSRMVLRLGLFLYDYLASRRAIPGSASVDLSCDPMGRALKPEFRFGFSYYDCWVDDARLVIAVAQDAAQRGATILTRTPVTQLTPRGDVWEIGAAATGGLATTIRARALVNAAGPWCAHVARLVGASALVPVLRLVRGAHIVVPRLPGADDAYLLQNNDGRVVFALPFEQRFTLIGTTETPVETPAEGNVVGRDEEQYLLDAAGRFFNRALTREDIVWQFAGVRPLVDDGSLRASAVSRDYRLDLIHEACAPPLLNVIGGKITTFRRLAEAALTRLRSFFPSMGSEWTAQQPLPGGDMEIDGVRAHWEGLVRQRPGISPDALFRLVRLYGTRADVLLGDAAREADLGEALGAGLTEREVLYLRDHEWARAAEDILWRRTKAGLHMSAAERSRAEAAIARLISV